MYAIRPVIDPPWTDVPPRRIGGVPTGLGTPDRYILVGSDDAPRLRIDLYSPGAPYYRTDVRVLDTVVVVGFQWHVAIVPFSDTPVRTRRLCSYFGAFYDYDDYLLVASGGDVTRVDRDGTVAWQSDMLGLDGIVIERVEDGVIHGQGEWDPPGGWRPFAIAVENARA